LIPFIKAHACGNDFLIVNEDDVRGMDKAILAQQLCERNTGIGADGVEFFEWTGDFAGRIRLHNADGSVGEISGNGTRCVAAWMAEERSAQTGEEFSIETDAGTRLCTIEEFHDSDLGGPTVLITTDMDVPEFEERIVELSDGTAVEGVYVSMGNPHFVIVLPPPEADQFRGGSPLDSSARTLNRLDFSINERSWDDIGEEICHHPDFPDQTNVEFVHILSGGSEPAHQIGIRIFERGVGPTTSSGTGTSAAATAMIGVFNAAQELDVLAAGGMQTVRWAGPGQNLFLTGPATLIARGEVW
jgi:diaminopimelate epimerase